jgi:hypothetical protein
MSIAVADGYDPLLLRVLMPALRMLVSTALISHITYVAMLN